MGVDITEFNVYVQESNDDKFMYLYISQRTPTSTVMPATWLFKLHNADITLP